MISRRVVQMTGARAYAGGSRCCPCWSDDYSMIPGVNRDVVGSVADCHGAHSWNRGAQRPAPWHGLPSAGRACSRAFGISFAATVLPFLGYGFGRAALVRSCRVPPSLRLVVLPIPQPERLFAPERLVVQPGSEPSALWAGCRWPASGPVWGVVG